MIESELRERYASIVRALEDIGHVRSRLSAIRFKTGGRLKAVEQCLAQERDRISLELKEMNSQGFERGVK